MLVMHNSDAKGILVLFNVQSCYGDFANVTQCKINLVERV
jgi:hypothetical protein